MEIKVRYKNGFETKHNQRIAEILAKRGDVVILKDSQKTEESTKPTRARAAAGGEK